MTTVTYRDDDGGSKYYILTIDPDPRLVHGLPGQFAFPVRMALVGELTVETEINQEGMEEPVPATCPICYETLSEYDRVPVETPCRHIFCISCVVQHFTIENHGSCPMCRKSIFSDWRQIAQDRDFVAQELRDWEAHLQRTYWDASNLWIDATLNHAGSDEVEQLSQQSRTVATAMRGARRAREDAEQAVLTALALAEGPAAGLHQASPLSAAVGNLSL